MEYDDLREQFDLLDKEMKKTFYDLLINYVGLQKKKKEYLTDSEDENKSSDC